MDINLLRAPETLQKVRESQQKRYKSTHLVDLVVALDSTWRKMLFEINEKKKALNALQKEITDKKKAKESCDDLVEKLKAMKSAIEVEDRVEAETKQLLDAKLFQIGNLVHDSVPVSNDEANNGIVVMKGECRPHDDKLHFHHDLLYMIDGYEPQIGADIAGHRGYFLKGHGVLLNQALINYSLDFLRKKAYTVLQTPFFMNKKVMAKTAQLADFDEQLYKITDHEGDEKYLIATSEQPISAFHSGDHLTDEQLPKRYAGYSTNFRKEAGSYGRDVWGIFRVHQFEKVEQFCITTPEKSWDMHEEMSKIAQDFYESLGIAFRVVNIVSGELNDAAAKKYDLEGWFPGLNTYRELVSCSNCTDYQSRRLEIHYGYKDNEGGKKFVHMLNSTLCATSRTICCILENYQDEKGIKVPEVLKPYMYNIDYIPFTRGPLPKPKAEAKPAKK